MSLVPMESFSWRVLGLGMTSSIKICTGPAPMRRQTENYSKHVTGRALACGRRGEHNVDPEKFAARSAPMSSSPIYVGIRGNVFCLSRTTGQAIWSVGLTGSGFVTLLVDEDLVLAATRGEVFGLEA